MVALPSVSKVLKFTHSLLFNDTTLALVRFYEQYTGVAPIVGDLLTLGALYGPAFTADLAPVMSPNLSYSTVLIEDLSSPISAAAESAFTGLVGTEVGADIPAATTALINYEISRRYRGGKPKNFVPFGTGADLLTDQTWEVASADGFLGAWLDFFAVAGDNPWPGAGVISPVNISYYTGFTAVENPITHRYRNVPNMRVTPLVDLITAVTISGRPHFQTRRGV